MNVPVPLFIFLYCRPQSPFLFFSCNFCAMPAQPTSWVWVATTTIGEEGESRPPLLYSDP